jgi:hypothetical protein
MNEERGQPPDEPDRGPQEPAEPGERPPATGEPTGAPGAPPPGEPPAAPGAAAVGLPGERPFVRLLLTDDGERSRLTVFFRLLLAIPHFIVLALWGAAALILAFINWFIVLFRRQTPDGIHSFLASYIRYFVRVTAYVFLAANPWPPFGSEGGYPIDVEIDPPRPQNRWKTGFRLILAIPATFIAGALVASGSLSGGGAAAYGGLAASAAFLGWFAAMFTARMPPGLRDGVTYSLAYAAQLDAYLLLLTDRYPNSDPVITPAARPVAEHPVELTVDDDLQRSRLTVFFRFLLWLPHGVWFALWGIAAFVAAIMNWFVTLITGRSPEALHRFLAAYYRYGAHQNAYLFLIANPFPGFLGQEGSYPVDLKIGPPLPQNRWKTAFRLILAFPAFVVGGALGNAMFTAAFLGWFAALFTGRMPRGIRNMAAYGLRYTSQTNAYFYLLTERYPYSGPVRAVEPGAEAAPAAAVPVRV